MNARVIKEYQALRPFWGIALILPVVFRLFAGDDPGATVSLSMMGYVLGCALLGAVSFGLEWNYQTLELLLTQPVSRRQLWRYKIRWLGIALGTECLVALLCLFSLPDQAKSILDNVYNWLWIILPALWFLSVGPYLTIRTGNGIAAFVFAICLPFAWIASTALLLPANWANSEKASADAFFAWAIPLLLFALGAYWLTRYRFVRLETAGFSSTVIRVSDWFFKAAHAPPTTAVRPHSQRPTSRLVRKEFRLQETSDLVAGGIFLLCSLVIIGRLVYAQFNPQYRSENLDGPPISQIVFFLAVILGAMVMPIIIGVLTVAEERQLGVLEWQLTQPPSHFRQWLVKLLVTYGHTIGLAMLMPITTVALTYWLSPADHGLETEWIGWLGNPDVPYFAVGSLLLTTVAHFASSLAKTSLRAIFVCLGSITLVVVIFRLGTYFPRLREFLTQNLVQNLGGWPLKYWLLGIMVLGAFLLILRLSYNNYRRLETRLAPMVQTLLVSLAVVFILSAPLYLTRFRQIDAQAAEVGLKGPVLAAYLRGENLEPVVAELDKMLDDPARAVQAIHALVPGCYGREEALPVMLKALGHEYPEVRTLAAMGLLNQWQLLQSQAMLIEQHRSLLRQCLQDPDPPVREAAAVLLAQIRDHPANLVPILIEMLSDENPFLSQIAIFKLAHLGHDARAAVPALLQIARTESKAPAQHNVPGSKTNAPQYSGNQRLAIVALQKIAPEVLRQNNLPESFNE